MMRESRLFYIDGAWVEPAGRDRFTVINPATEAPEGEIALGDASDVDRAVLAARRAFPAFARTSVAERIELLETIIAEYKKRRSDLAEAITAEMGAPVALADRLHAMMGHVHLKTTIGVLKDYPFVHRRGGTTIVHEPIGVCALITPWNWPINQIAAKVVPALACGCTMVLKPSEYSPFSATIWAEVMHAAGVPAGVFNMIHGTGPTVGAALSAHPEVDMITFTGSTKAGIEVARAAAPTIKRVHQELGGKSANIILPDADLAKAVADGVHAVTNNSGQSCNAPTRMLVPMARMAEASRLAAEAADALHVGDPQEAKMGPVVSRIQFDRIQTLIQAGIDDGATLVAGGPGRPEGLDTGYYVRPTVFGDVTNDMTIAREEIFGPVVSLIGYDDIEQAITIANDSPYGIAGYVYGSDPATIQEVASRLRVGQVIVNHATPDPLAPFGGYKQSGNGREWGAHAFEGFLEVKAVLGAPQVEAA
jgi:aldehyde dehydrogenase (NAD+)